jgi:hypothetical protein
MHKIGVKTMLVPYGGMIIVFLISKNDFITFKVILSLYLLSVCFPLLLHKMLPVKCSELRKKKKEELTKQLNA